MLASPSPPSQIQEGSPASAATPAPTASPPPAQPISAHLVDIDRVQPTRTNANTWIFMYAHADKEVAEMLIHVPKEKFSLIGLSDQLNSRVQHDRLVLLVSEDEDDEDIPAIPGLPAAYSFAANFPPCEEDMCPDIDEDVDDENHAYRQTPGSLPISINALRAREITIVKRIIRQKRLLKIMRNRARAIHGDQWENGKILKEDVGFLADHKYIVEPPAPGSEAALLRRK
ncbi:hypothetical protein FPQ18DRAFT_391306 [Pyronema domesticum]|nr:hypothetical protein FPQ18DRAFT_391306 [Pyronema domesticum]